MKNFLYGDMTVEDVHFCLDCDDLTEQEIEADHSITVSDEKLRYVMGQGFDEEVAKDMLQHYQSDGAKDFDPQNAITEFYEHAKFHNGSKLH